MLLLNEHRVHHWLQVRWNVTQIGVELLHLFEASWRDKDLDRDPFRAKVSSLADLVPREASESIVVKDNPSERLWQLSQSI